MNMGIIKEELEEDELDIFCIFINDIIEQAISHGGDGGAYYTNQEELEQSIYCFIHWLGIEDKVVLYRDKEPKLLLKTKLKTNKEE